MMTLTQRLSHLSIIALVALLPNMAQANSQNPLCTEHRPEILGLWALQEKGNQCVEYYNFRKNKQLLIVSGEERIVAEYDYQEPENLEQKHPLMTMKVLADNGQTDCWGDRADQSNSTQVTQIRWENPHQLQLCFDEKSCFTMHRVRP